MQIFDTSNFFQCTFDFKRKTKAKTDYLYINRVVVNLVISPQIDFSSLPLSLRSFYNQTKEVLIKAKVEDKVKWEIILPMNFSRSLIYFVFRQTIPHYITHASNVFYTMWFYWSDQWKQV